MKKIKIIFVFLFAVLVFATGCGYLPDLDVSFTSNSNGNSSSVTKEYYDMSGVSFNGASYVYDGEEHSLSIEGTLPDGVSVMYLNNNKVNAGTYEVTAKFTGDTKNYYPIEDMKATLTIAKAGVSGISFLGDTVTYDGNPHSIEIIGELPEGILVTYSGNEQVNVGEYEVVAHFTDTTGNYVELSDLKATLTINKATYDMSGIKFNSASYTYDGIEKEVKIDGVLPSGVEVLYENNRMINAGTIEAIAMFKHNNPNYNDIPNKTATLTISKASIEGISFSGDTVTYDGKSHSLSIEGKLPEGVYVTYINNGHINAGTYTVTAHFEDSTGNYEYLPDLEATLVINKVDVNEIEFNGKTVVYNGEVHSLEIEGTLPSGVQVIYSNNNHINAGTYTVVASFIDTIGNYNIVERLEAILTISKASIEGISFSGDTVTYDGKEHLLNIEGELPNGVYVIYSNNKHINAGTYIVTAQIIDTTGNYIIPEIFETSLTINKATYDMSNVSFKNTSYVYDGKEHSLIIEGTLPEGVKVEYYNNGKVNAGEYEVIAKFVGDEENYHLIEDMRSTLVINKANIEGISFVGETVTYNGSFNSIYINGNLPNGVYVSYSNNSQINAGEYEITAVFNDTTGNYIVPEPMTAVLKINKLTIAVSLEDQTFSYDGEYHSLILNGYIPEGIIVNCSNNSFNKVGEYIVKYIFIDITGNYNIVESIEGTLTIVKDGKYHDVYIDKNMGPVEHFVIKDGELVKNIPSTPYKEGYTYKWNYDFNNPIVKDEYIILECLPNKYTITYNTLGGELDDYTQVVEYNSEFALSIPTKAGYTFIGWLLNDELFKEEKYLLLEDIILDALWSKDVIFDGNTNDLFWTEDVMSKPVEFVTKNEELKVNIYAFKNASGIYFYLDYKTKESFSKNQNWWQADHFEFRLNSLNGVLINKIEESKLSENQFWVSLCNQEIKSNVSQCYITTPIYNDEINYYELSFEFFVAYEDVSNNSNKITNKDLIGFTFGINYGGNQWYCCNDFYTSDFNLTYKITENGIVDNYDEDNNNLINIYNGKDETFDCNKYWYDGGDNCYTIHNSSDSYIINYTDKNSWSYIRTNVSGLFGNFNKINFSYILPSYRSMIVKVEGIKDGVYISREIEVYGTDGLSNGTLDISTLTTEERDSINCILIFVAPGTDISAGNLWSESLILNSMQFSGYVERKMTYFNPYVSTDGGVSYSETTYISLFKNSELLVTISTDYYDSYTLEMNEEYEIISLEYNDESKQYTLVFKEIGVYSLKLISLENSSIYTCLTAYIYDNEDNIVYENNFIKTASDLGYIVKLMTPDDSNYKSCVTDLNAYCAYYINEIDSNNYITSQLIVSEFHSIDSLIFSLNDLMQDGFDSTFYNGCAVGGYLYATFFVMSSYPLDSNEIMFNITRNLEPVFVDVDSSIYNEVQEEQSALDYVIQEMEAMGYVTYNSSNPGNYEEKIAEVIELKSTEENIIKDVYFFENSDGAFVAIIVYENDLINFDGQHINVDNFGYGYFISIGHIYGILSTWVKYQSV